MVKAALALHHRVLPPTIGVTEPNPKANFPESPFYVNTEARPWLAERRRALPAARGGQRLRLRRHQFPHRARGVHRRLPAAVQATVERWPAELLLWRGDAGRDRRLAGARWQRSSTRAPSRSWPTWR